MPERVDAVKQNADASKYLRAHFLLSNIRKKYLLGRITFQEYRTIRGHAIGGDLDGCDRLPEGIQGVQDVHLIRDALAQRGYEEALLDDIF